MSPPLNESHAPSPSSNGCGESLPFGYHFRKVISKGSNTTVVMAIHQESGEAHAVKMVNRSFVNRSPRRVTRIQQEIGLLRMMDHPNITKFIDSMETPMHTIIILEYMEGGNLLHHLRSYENGFPADQAFRYFRQVISAVEYCHSIQIVHRDIKLENILLDASGEIAKLTDFGLACYIPEGQLMDTSCGSPHYAAPEIIRGEKYEGPPTDIYSLGVVLYAMCCGRLPYVDSSIPALVRKVVQGHYEMPEHFSGELQHLVWEMMQLAPKDRPTLASIKKHPWWQQNCGASFRASTLAIPVPENAPTTSSKLLRPFEILYASLLAKPTTSPFLTITVVFVLCCILSLTLVYGFPSRRNLPAFTLNAP